MVIVFDGVRAASRNLSREQEMGTDRTENRTYIAIDLKSFYASVECVERDLDPLRTNLVVADESRTEKTICLAVSPALKAYGIPGRARLFEVVQRVREVNTERRQAAPGRRLTGKSCDADALQENPELELSFIAAPPRMALYMKYSTQIYQIYLRYIAPEDIHVYSVDEVFIDATQYLWQYQMSARSLAVKMLRDVLETTGITATAGIGTNLYLCKIAMDIEAKHTQPDENGVRIAELDEMSYRRKLWTHRPLTDFWRVGGGYAKKLEEHGMFTMGDVARCSIGEAEDYHNEDLLYELFGVNAELLIDHAWGWEPCTIADIKAYKPSTNSISSGQVLKCPYTADKARLIVREMTDLLVLDLVDKGLVTDQLVLTVGYDIENLTRGEIRSHYKGPVTTDHYGRRVPKAAHGTINLDRQTSSTRMIMDAVMELYTRIIDARLLVRRMYVVANHVVPETEAACEESYEQLDLFTDYETLNQEKQQHQEELEREKKMQHAVLDIKKRFGKNAILKGMNLEEGATTIERNGQIGGHRS
jgi:DNA polymerase V